MDMVWVTLGAGSLGGLYVGWQAGRLYQRALRNFHDYRGAVRTVPGARSTAITSAKDSVGYVVGALVLVVIAVWMIAA